MSCRSHVQRLSDNMPQYSHFSLKIKSTVAIECLLKPFDLYDYPIDFGTYVFNKDAYENAKKTDDTNVFVFNSSSLTITIYAKYENTRFNVSAEGGLTGMYTLFSSGGTWNRRLWIPSMIIRTGRSKRSDSSSMQIHSGLFFHPAAGWHISNRDCSLTALAEWRSHLRA